MIFTTLLFLSTTSVASAIPVASNTTNTLNPLGRPYCTPTGPGVCNLAFSWWYEKTWNQHDAIYVYNRFCNEIGSTSGDNLGAFEIYSELPYVVVGTMNPDARFRYAAGSYGDNCGYYSDGIVQVKQCAFDC